MPYPNSPFSDDFDKNILSKLYDDEDTTVNEIQNDELDETLKWLCKSPKATTFRVNTIKADPVEVLKNIEKVLKTIYAENQHCCGLKLELHPLIPEAVILQHPVVQDAPLTVYEKEVLVDTTCATAILRGAHLFAPGVLSMQSNTQIGDNVSIYADISKKCKRGLQKVFEGSKILVGNGIVRMTRGQLFCNNSESATGVAVIITETVSNCPPIGDDILPSGQILLQNLPSIVAVHVLNPQPNDVVLDMCAAPGNKTTHIAALMQNKGQIIAIDKTPTKIHRLKSRCEEFSAKVEVLQADSTKLLSLDNWKFKPNCFNKILLDAPCSALGKRPQLINVTMPKVIRSYVPLQRKLFASAVDLLTDEGVLVYSTCTITLAENEGIVAWALKKFKTLKLVEAVPIFGNPGWNGTDLTERELKLVQRFGPNQNVDSVGFFIAKFMKIKD